LAAADNDEGARRILQGNGMSTIRSGKALALKKRQVDQRGAVAKKPVGKVAAKKPGGTVSGANDFAKKPAPTNLKAQAARVVERLKADYPGATCALENETPFELLVATILSAQCTDARVNMVTPELYRRWPTAVEMADAPIKALEKVIQSTGFYRNKAKNIKAASGAIVERHNGEVPRDMEQLVALPGVGRKTANVVLGTAFGMASGVVVDTHVTRLSQRLGLTKHTDAVKIEQDLMRIVPQEEWVDFSHRLIFHGRQICTARKPKFPECSMRAFCPKIGVIEVEGRGLKVEGQKAGKRQEARVKSQKGPG
jgi:endonuclease-3